MARKSRISVTIDRELLKWIDEEVARRRFASRSHGVEWCVQVASKTPR